QYFINRLDVREPRLHKRSPALADTAGQFSRLFKMLGLWLFRQLFAASQELQVFKGHRHVIPRSPVAAAGLRKFRFHDIRHTFGSLLIQAGVSPAYVQKQMGHKSIQVTVDTCGHLIPGDNVEWIDVLDKAPAAPQTHTQEEAIYRGYCK